MMHKFGLSKEIPSCEFNPDILVVVSAAINTERSLLEWPLTSSTPVAYPCRTQGRWPKYRGQLAFRTQCGWLLRLLQTARQLPLTANSFFIFRFFHGRAVIRPVGAPPIRAVIRPGRLPRPPSCQTGYSDLSNCDELILDRIDGRLDTSFICWPLN